MSQLSHTPSSHPSTHPLKFNRLILPFILIFSIAAITLLLLSLATPIGAIPVRESAPAILGGDGGLHGLKWHDLNGNGIREADEPTLPGWTIFLEGEGQVLSTTTNTEGHYWFMDIATGTYTIEEVMQPDWVQTWPPDGYYQVSYVPSQPIDGLDFGNYLDTPGSIHGTKWHDLDGDGHFDDNETGLPNWQIFIEGNDIFSHTFTDAQGHYWFMDLPPGLYGIWEEERDDWQQTFPETHHTVELRPGDTVENVNFGNWQPNPGEIHGLKWHDLNGDGHRDTNEPGLAGWVIRLQVDDQGTISETVTDDQGHYWFMGLMPGAYFVVENMQDGWQQTFPEAGFHYLELESGQVIDGLNFGNWQPEPGEIHGMKFYDQDGDGVKDPTEPGIPGWGIIIESGDFIADAVTNQDGEYWFMDLMPGEYTIAEVHEAGWQQTYPPEGVHVVQLGAGQTITEMDFGNWDPVPSSLHGTKFHDLNGNGVQDADEPVLPGWTILLQAENGTVIRAETDENGRYWFMDLFPGTYHVAELHHFLSGWTQTTPASTHKVEVDQGQEIHDLDFGNWQQGKDDFCIMPWDNHFLNEEFLETQVYIFNASDMPEKGYTVHMIGLPAGTIFPSDVDGSTTFEVLTPLPITLNPNEFGTVDVRVDYPPAFAAGAEHRAVIQAIVTNLATGESFGCHAALWPMLDWWTAPVVNQGIGEVPFGFTLAVGFTVTNNMPLQPPGLMRSLLAGETVSYTVTAMTPGHDLDPVIRLNGLLPGADVVGELTLDRGESAVIEVDVQFTENISDTLSDILFELDVDQDGIPDAVTSVLVRSAELNYTYLPFISKPE